MEDTDFIILWGSNAVKPIRSSFTTSSRPSTKAPACMPSIRAGPRLPNGPTCGSVSMLVPTLPSPTRSAGKSSRPGFTIRISSIGPRSGSNAYRQSVDEWTLEKAEAVTGVPAGAIRDLAHEYATAGTAQLCWTLGITEHHNATDNVLALINLALLTGHVGRYGSGLVPIRGQNNVQGGGDMGALPNKLPGFQDIENDEARERFESVWRVALNPVKGWHLSQMVEAMERGDLRTLYVIGENPAQSEADSNHTVELLRGLDFMVVQDIYLTRTAELADVVLPAAAGWVETEGTVTSSERRVQRVRKALDPPGEARDDLDILSDLARRMGHDWGTPTAEEAWDELRSLSPIHAGMSYRRLEELGGLQWPCRDQDDPGELFLHGRLWDDPPGGPPAPFTPVQDVAAARCADRGVPHPPDDRPSVGLVQHRRAKRRLRIARFDMERPSTFARGRCGAWGR